MAWYDDDATWTDLQDVLFPSAREAAADAEIDAVLALTGTPAGARVLDLPCGVGRHSAALARRGFRVTGVDRTAAYLDRARARPEGVTWLRADMRDFHTDTPFDLVLNLWTSFGYFEDPADDLRAARCFHDALRPGGTLGMEMNGKEVLARQYRSRDWYPFDGGVLLEERSLRDDWTWIDSRWTVFAGDRRVERTISVRPFAASEIKALLRAAGFPEARCFGGLDGSPYDQDAKRLVVIARR